MDGKRRAETIVLRESPAPALLFPSSITCGLAWEKPRTSAVWRLRLTAYDTAQLNYLTVFAYLKESSLHSPTHRLAMQVCVDQNPFRSNHTPKHMHLDFCVHKDFHENARVLYAIAPQPHLLHASVNISESVPSIVGCLVESVMV